MLQWEQSQTTAKSSNKSILKRHCKVFFNHTVFRLKFFCIIFQSISAFRIIVYYLQIIYRKIVCNDKILGLKVYKVWAHTVDIHCNCCPFILSNTRHIMFWIGNNNSSKKTSKVYVITNTIECQYPKKC